MSRRRSARLQSQAEGADAKANDAGFDERLEFLWTSDETSSLPIRARFEHRVEGAAGLVEAVYWPARQISQAPEQLGLFVLGEPSHLGRNDLAHSKLP
jgi:hypothetical protein